ncbi:hypothetical protein MesoLjLa_68200 (plasmid) [Mesorhizobium sp. L-2-11]|nr:hypothetical protein MesoLjLa_68200 [Mesorhizobium sp. L-2-11]
MWAKWMIPSHTRHYTCISKKNTVEALRGPSADTIFALSNTIAVELQLAFCFVDWSAKVGHDLRIGVHLRECKAMIISPILEPWVSCLNHGSPDLADLKAGQPIRTTDLVAPLTRIPT